MGADSAEPLRRATVLRSGYVDPALQNRQPKSLPSVLFQRGGHDRRSGWSERPSTPPGLFRCSQAVPTHQVKSKGQAKTEKEPRTNAQNEIPGNIDPDPHPGPHPGRLRRRPGPRGQLNPNRRGRPARKPPPSTNRQLRPWNPCPPGQPPWSTWEHPPRNR